ncbi:hypothetical protein [Rhodoglobus vestalii]|uniref:hypothetical protein n=1 Tax=Rhodoglobus vestalii TaxID=193384 RepID=UPI00319E3D75
MADGARYVMADVTNAAELLDVLAPIPDRIALYFALPPAITQKVCRALANETLPEEQIFRVDHFLGKSTVLNLLGLRFANRVFEPPLAAPNVAKVELIFDEPLALEGRAGYYDRAGAVVDMIQSHLLLVLALTAMEPPASVSSEDLRGAMAPALRAARVQTNDGTSARRARYTAGTIGAARQDIVITFAPVPHLPRGLTGMADPAQLTISIKPATLELDLIVNGEGDPFTLDRTKLTTTLGDAAMSAYGEVIASLIDGDPVLSVRGDIAEQCWRIVTPVLDAFRQNRGPLDEYAAGSEGPTNWSTR